MFRLILSLNIIIYINLSNLLKKDNSAETLLERLTNNLLIASNLRSVIVVMLLDVSVL